METVNFVVKWTPALPVKKWSQYEDDGVRNVKVHNSGMFWITLV